MSHAAKGSVISLLPEGIEIPAGIADLEGFRVWARSDSFPEAGRIDAADLAVECVSDASVRKDLGSLRDRYHRAGVREYWIADARQEALDFQVLRRRFRMKPGRFAAAPAGCFVAPPQRSAPQDRFVVASRIRLGGARKSARASS